MIHAGARARARASTDPRMHMHTFTHARAHTHTHMHYGGTAFHGQKRRRKKNDKGADTELVNKNFYAIEKVVKELQVC